MAEKLHAKLCGQSELVQEEPAICHQYLRSPRFRLHRNASGSTDCTSKAATGWGEKNTAVLPQPARPFCEVSFARDEALIGAQVRRDARQPDGRVCCRVIQMETRFRRKLCPLPQIRKG